jgi:hypothetical protein
MLLTACSCSSAPKRYYFPESDANSKADAAAYSADGMFYRKPVQDHRDDKKWEFYYKQCSLAQDVDVPFTSKRDYTCSNAF